MLHTLQAALRHQTVRFVITGATAAALFAVLDWSALSLSLPPFAGTAAAYAVTVVASYTVQRAWTFRGRHRHGQAFPRYLAAQIGCACLTAAIAQVLARFGLSAAATSGCVTLIGSAASFCLSRYWVFPATRGAVP